MPGRIVPSRPISHSPPNTDSETTYSPFGQHLDVLGEPERQAGEVDRARELGLEAVPVAE